MRILALDTSLAACSVAVLDGGAVLARRHDVIGRGHAERLMPMLAEVLAAAGVGIGDMDRLAVTTGPGTFTGIRVGLAAARGLALATGRPLIGVTTFEALVAAQSEPDAAGRPALVAVDAGRGDIYVQLFDSTHAPLTPPSIVAIGDIPALLPAGPTWLIGPAAEGVKAAAGMRAGDLTLAPVPGNPDAVQVARLAVLRAPPAAGAPPVGPLYLRTPAYRRIGQAAPE
jgi:tRNA threonylcarbamoyladenosine biosynthesis protein TsaB